MSKIIHFEDGTRYVLPNYTTIGNRADNFGKMLLEKLGKDAQMEFEIICTKIDLAAYAEGISNE